MKLREAFGPNEQKKCSVPDCPKHRQGISKYCSAHRYRIGYHGHPEARPFKSKEYENEREQIKHLVELNAEHSGIKYGIEFFNKMLEAAGKGVQKIPAYTLIARLYDAGVTGEELLIETGSLYLLYEEGKIIKSDNHLIKALGNKIIRFKGYSGFLSGVDFANVGKYIIRHIGVLALNLAKTSINMESKRNAELMNMHQPLKF